ncbi:MAG TPA: hypothetical protein HPQ00_02460 [Magnetococcales bacterium]|nr:hypothetical protein [Magnetococcales bacterium]
MLQTIIPQAVTGRHEQGVTCLGRNFLLVQDFLHRNHRLDRHLPFNHRGQNPIHGNFYGLFNLILDQYGLGSGHCLDGGGEFCKLGGLIGQCVTGVPASRVDRWPVDHSWARNSAFLPMVTVPVPHLMPGLPDLLQIDPTARFRLDVSEPNISLDGRYARASAHSR